MPQQPWKPRAVVATAFALALTAGCMPQQDQARETPVNEAQPGDVLVTADNTDVVLTKAFKPGIPNGLYDGAVSTKSTTGETYHYEVNAICSMPDLPGWPDYDNIYGKPIDAPSDAGQTGGETQWQTLLRFDGTVSEQGAEPSPKWAERLANNLCRKGDFEDASSNGNKTPEAPLAGQSLDVNREATTP